MILSKKTKHGLLSMGLAFGILTSSVVSPASVSVLASDYSARNVLSDAYIQSQFPAPISEEDITSASVRSEALQLQSSKRAFDLDLSGQSFDGSGGIDYSKNAKYMDVLKNLKTTQNDQTIILRFKTSSDGLLFGAGTDALTTTGKNMTVSIRDGKLRLVMRNTKKANGAPAGGLKGSFNVNLADGNWHTVAISFLPSLNYVNDNVRIAVDGTNLNYASNTWGSSWKAGFNQGAGADYNLLQIGGGSYVGVNNNDYASANFNGKIDFITVIDKAYSMDDLKSISYEQVSSVTTKLNAMRQSGTGKTWLFTGGTEAVADFKNSSTIRNWIGLFEDTMRSGGSYIERGRFVFNTARRGSDVASILADYDRQIDAYHTEAVAISVGAEDYSKGQAGLDTFKENLKKLVDKINASRKLAVVITPYPSKDPVQNTKIALYKAAIDAVVSEDAKIVDFSSIAVSNINDDGTLTLEGHQAAANLLKNALGFGSSTTSYNFHLKNLAPGSYRTEKKENADQITAKANGTTLEVHAGGVSDSGAKLTYTLTDSNGQIFSGSASASNFTVSGLKPGETYTLTVSDNSRFDGVTETYKPVSIKITDGSTGTLISETSDSEYDFSDLLKSEKALTYLFMGDSITHGVVTNGYDNVPQLFAKYLDELGRKDDVVINTGVSNATIATTLDQIETRLKRYQPDVAVIMLGTNDCAKNGENNVAATGSTSNGAISVTEFKNRYKTLIREIHKNNANTRIVLRVPCAMINYGQRQETFEAFFASIPEVAKEMKTEIPGLEIAVVNHLENWNNYHDTVRNDNLSNPNYADADSLNCGWFSPDGLHPNGRGNIAMFQQIIKELNLYQANSELANFSYALSDWTDASNIKVVAEQKDDQASLAMNQFASYTNGLRDVTLTLTAQNGTSISKTTAYDANGSVSLDTLDKTKDYTLRVTGTDKTNSKQVTFVSELTKEITPDPIPDPKPKPDPTPDPTPTPTPDKPTDNQPSNPGTSDTTKVLKKGDIVAVGKYSYQITNTAKKTAAFAGLVDENVKKVSIAASVKINNTAYRITSVKANALKGKKKITSVTIGKNVATIGAKAFSGCKNLKKITVKTTTLKKVGKQAFKGIHKKAAVKVPRNKKTAYKKKFRGIFSSAK